MPSWHFFQKRKKKLRKPFVSLTVISQSTSKCKILKKTRKVELRNGRGPRERVPPSTTNYDVHSPTWGDGRPALLPSAMEATNPGHEPH